jgi:hypothetical protein
VAGEDPLTPGEIRRALERLERADQAQADRTTQVASDMLSAKLWDVQRRVIEEKLNRHEREIDDLGKEREKRSEITWTKIIGLITALATLAAVIVGVIGLTKGIK